MASFTSGVGHLVQQLPPQQASTTLHPYLCAVAWQIDAMGSKWLNVPSLPRNVVKVVPDVGGNYLQPGGFVLLLNSAPLSPDCLELTAADLMIWLKKSIVNCNLGYPCGTWTYYWTQESYKRTHLHSDQSDCSSQSCPSMLHCLCPHEHGRLPVGK